MLIAEKQFEAKVDCLDEFLEFAIVQANIVGILSTKLMHFQIALEEVFVNITSYAYSDGSMGNILVRIYFAADKRHLTVELIDTGSQFNPLKKPFPDTMGTADDREIGGLGILFVKKMTQDLYYKREDGKNILGLVFYV